MVLRGLKTVFPIILGITLLIVLLIVPVSNIPNVQNNVIAVQKIVGIAQLILGISTILMTLPGIRFFIKMEREHYGILNSYVFYPLSTLQLKTRSDPSKMLPTFMDNIPNQYYLDAERHMKKDGDRLDKVVTSFKAKLKEVNEKINDLNEVISTRINEVFMEKGIDLDKGKDNAEVKTINYWIRHYIRQCIESDNIYQIANQLPGGLKAVEIFSDGSKRK